MDKCDFDGPGAVCLGCEYAGACEWTPPTAYSAAMDDYARLIDDLRKRIRAGWPGFRMVRHWNGDNWEVTWTPIE